MNSESEEIDLPPNAARGIRVKLSIIRILEAEKRTHLAELRTGTAILAIPMSLLTILIATSNLYNPADVIVFVVSLLVGVIALSIIGVFLIYRSLKRIRKTEDLRDAARPEIPEMA
ncbi:MAG: hypothetical protein R6V83_01445 [Candidatus Thorarchaeota archaeon]